MISSDCAHFQCVSIMCFIAIIILVFALIVIWNTYFLILQVL